MMFWTFAMEAFLKLELFVVKQITVYLRNNTPQ